jgi:tetratricopeptide (TPR) repeat protein
MAAETTTQISAQAEKAYQAGRHSEAAALYQQATAQYAAQGDRLKAAEMANNHSVALLQAGQAQAALEASSGTDAVFAQTGETRKQGLALGNQAAALEALNRLDEALERYRQCSDLLKQAGDSDSRAYVLKSISALQIRTGHQLEGLASMEAALENKKKLSLQERILKKIIQVPFRMLKRGG